MKKSILLSFVIAISPLASAMASQLPADFDACERALEQRPTSRVPNILLQPGDWIPRAPKGFVYLNRGPIIGGPLRYGYELVSEFVQQRHGETLPELPLGYIYVPLHQLESYPPIDVYRIALVHPFPKAGAEGKPLDSAEHKLVTKRLDRLAQKLHLILMSRAMQEEMDHMLTAELKQSQLIMDQLGGNVSRLVRILLRDRMTIRNNVAKIGQTVLGELPIGSWLMRWPRKPGPGLSPGR